MTDDPDATRDPRPPASLDDETPGMRNRACCRSEPECQLCPLLPGNHETSLAALWRKGLYANLPKLGFR